MCSEITGTEIQKVRYLPQNSTSDTAGDTWLV